MNHMDLRQILSINAPALYRAAMLLLIEQPGVELDDRGKPMQSGEVGERAAELLAVIRGIQAEMFHAQSGNH